MATTNSGSSGGGPPPSQQRLGHYRIVRQIARSNDIVYEALDPAINRKIALKELLIPPHLAGQQRRERIERFQREAKAIGALNHPNIVTIYEIGQEGERHFIAMEFLEGPTLRDVLNLRGPLPMTEALQIGVQFSEALGYAHSMGIIHRDVKPDNAHLIPPNNLVKLTDFGIARMETEPTLTSAGQIFGTPSYMSPEQIAARGLDHRSDVFSLGVVLYEMIVGRKPFIGDSVVTITYHIMNTPPAIPANIPPGVAGVLTRALAKDRDERYQNMAALAGDLRSEILFHESPYHKQSGGFADVSGPRSARPVTQPRPAATVAATPSPATAGAAPAQRSGPASVRPATAPSRATGGGRSVLTLALSVIGILLIACLTVWAIVASVHALQANNRMHTALSDYEQGVAAQKAGDTARAIDEYSKALREAPPGSDVTSRARQALTQNYVAAGSQAISTGNVSDAQQNYMSAIATDGQNASAHYGLALSYQQQNDTPDALREFAAAAKADPFGQTGIDARQRAASGYFQMGEQAEQSGNMAAARDDWQQVIAVDPTSALADQARQKINQAGTAPTPGNTTGEESTTGPADTTAGQTNSTNAGASSINNAGTTASQPSSATSGMSPAPSSQSTTGP